MTDPIFVNCPKGVWTKVASDIRGGRISRVTTGSIYSWTYRIPEEPAPVLSEGVTLFSKNNTEKIMQTSGIDLYIFCRRKAGSVRIDDAAVFVENLPQDQTTPWNDFYFVQANGAPTTLTADSVVGDRIISVDCNASGSAGEIIYDYNHAFEESLNPTLLVHFTLNYKINKPKHASTWSLNVINATGVKEFYGFRRNLQTGEIEPEMEAIVIPNISYKIEF